MDESSGFGGTETRPKMEPEDNEMSPYRSGSKPETMGFFQRLIYRWFTCVHEWNDSTVLWHNEGNVIDEWSGGGSPRTRYSHTCFLCGKEEKWTA